MQRMHGEGGIHVLGLWVLAEKRLMGNFQPAPALTVEGGGTNSFAQIEC